MNLAGSVSVYKQRTTSVNRVRVRVEFGGFLYRNDTVSVYKQRTEVNSRVRSDLDFTGLLILGKR